MFDDLRPWIESNVQADDFYKPQLRSLNTIQPVFNPHFELQFIRHFSSKTQYFKKLIDNDITEYCNTLFNETNEASDNRIAYKIDKSNKTLHACIKELSEIINTQNLDLALISSQHADFSTDKLHKESTYIIFYLLSSLIKCCLEVQQHFYSFIPEDDIMEVSDFYTRLLQQQAPANTFIKKIKIIEIEVQTQKIDSSLKKEIGGTPQAFTYKHLQKQSTHINDLYNALKNNNRIASDTSITEFKHAFSGIVVANPIQWIGAKSELPYLIKYLCNTLQVLEWQGSIWQTTCNCFVDKNRNRFKETNLKDQKKPVTTAAEIEKYANLMK